MFYKQLLIASLYLFATHGIRAADITERKIDCAGYRTQIAEFERILKQNKAAEEFYSNQWLMPVSYARYFMGYDERLVVSNAQARREIHFFKDLLNQANCADLQ